MHLFIYLFIYLLMYLFIYLFIRLFHNHLIDLNNFIIYKRSEYKLSKLQDPFYNKIIIIAML